MVASSISSKNTWVNRSASSSSLSAPPQTYSVAGAAARISSSRRAGSKPSYAGKARQSPALLAPPPRRRQGQRTAQETGRRHHQCMPGPAGQARRRSWTSRRRNSRRSTLRSSIFIIGKPRRRRNAFDPTRAQADPTFTDSSRTPAGVVCQVWLDGLQAGPAGPAGSYPSNLTPNAVDRPPCLIHGSRHRMPARLTPLRRRHFEMEANQRNALTTSTQGDEAADGPERLAAPNICYGWVFSSLLLMSADHSFGAAGFAHLTP